MNLDELQSVRSKERRTDSLQHLRDSFYEDVREYLAGRKAERDAAAERADDPFASPEVRQLTDEIESAREVVEAVYERRMGKLVKHASLVAAGMDPDEEGMTTEERELFFDLVDRIQANKETVLGTIDGTSDGTDGATTEETPTPEQAEGVSAADAMIGTDETASADGSDSVDTDPADAAGTAEPADPGPDRRPESRDETTPTSRTSPAADESPRAEGGRSTANPDAAGETPNAESSESDPSSTSPTERIESDDRVMLRMTADVGEILGVDDRAYDLESEDVVSLPRQNAEPLLEREAAERLE